MFQNLTEQKRGSKKTSRDKRVAKSRDQANMDSVLVQLCISEQVLYQYKMTALPQQKLVVLHLV